MSDTQQNDTQTQTPYGAPGDQGAELHQEYVEPDDKPVDNTPAATTHVVQPGDTLESIAAKYGMDAGQLYAYNSTHIEGNASARGLGGSEGGRILFPGTELNLTPPNGAANIQVNSAPSQEIARLSDLNKQGVITDAEFASAKAKLLGI